MMIRSLRSADWSKPLRNASLVSIGKATQGVMSLAFVALAARTLGMEDFGRLVLIHGLVFGLSQMTRFQTWQAVIRYGAEALEDKDTPRLQRLVKFTTLLDMTAAVVSLTLIMVMIGPAGELFEVAPDLLDEIRVYGFSIIAMVMASTPLGVLRLLGRFDLIAIQTAIAPAIRLAGTLYLFLVGGGLIEFLAVWFVAAIVSRAVLLGLAWDQLGKAGLLRNIARPNPNPLVPEVGIWRFILGHNLSRGLFLSQAQLGLLMAGGLLGPAAAGIFRIAQQFSDVLIKPPTKLLMPAIYPELARLRAAKDHALRRSMILRMSVIAGGIAIAVFVILAVSGRIIITSLVGEDYAGAYFPMLWLAFAGLVTVLAFPLEPLLSSAGRIKQVILSQLSATIAYITGVLILVELHGLTGVAMATLGAAVCSTLMLAVFGRDLFSGSSD